MLGKLTQQEADYLIGLLKQTTEKAIHFPNGKGRVSFQVVGIHEEHKFVVNIDRKGKLAEKCTYQGRLCKNNQVLLRLDIDPNGRHTNPQPDGTVICGNHIHVYTQEFDMRMAMPFDVKNRDLYRICHDFFEKFHIIDPPTVVSQQIF